MYNFLVILIIVICLLLGIVVLMQNSKGGGLAANFSAPTQVMGVRQTTDFFEKATWWLAGILIVLCLGATIAISQKHTQANDPTHTEVTVTNDAMPMQQPTATNPIAD